MMEDFDIPLRRAPVAETPIASGGGIYAKIYRHSRSDFDAPSIDNHEVVLVLQGCGMFQTPSGTLGAFGATEM
jgi:hypothetical protein